MRKYTVGSITITEEQLNKFIVQKNAPKKTRKRTEKNENYWFIDDTGEVEIDKETCSSIDKERFQCRNYFSTKEEAGKEAKRLRAKTKILNYIEKNDLSMYCDWEDEDQRKYYPVYDPVQKSVHVDCSYGYMEQGEIPYMNQTNCEQLVREHGVNLLTYFGIE